MKGDPLIAVESTGEVGEEDEVRLGDAQLEERSLQVQLHRTVPVQPLTPLARTTATGLPAIEVNRIRSLNLLNKVWKINKTI